MAGNFRGMLIFVVDLAVKRLSHPRKLMPTVIWGGGGGGGGGMMMGVATNIVVARPTLCSNNSHCHPEDSIFDTNILLSHAIYPGLCRYGLVLNKERDRARVSITSSHCVQCHAPGLVAVTKFNGLSTKITRHTVGI